MEQRQPTIEDLLVRISELEARTLPKPRLRRLLPGRNGAVAASGVLALALVVAPGVAWPAGAAKPLLMVWGLAGNAGTNPGTNFLGTTDARDLVIKTNNVQAMRLMANGNVLVGLPGRSSDLTITGNVIAAGGSFANPIDGSITGNAATVTNGLYATGSYADPVWLTSLAGSKITGPVSSASNFSGTLAGDVSGHQGSTVVTGLQGTAVSATSPTDGQVLEYRATSREWLPAQPAAATFGGLGLKVITQSGTFTVPAGVTSLVFEAWGAGGGGGGGGTDRGFAPGAGGGGGGGSGGYIRTAVAVTPGQTYAITVGQGGAAGGLGANGANGGTSSIAALDDPLAPPLTFAGGGGGGSAGADGGSTDNGFAPGGAAGSAGVVDDTASISHNGGSGKAGAPGLEECNGFTCNGPPLDGNGGIGSVVVAQGTAQPPGSMGGDGGAGDAAGKAGQNGWVIVEW